MKIPICKKKVSQKYKKSKDLLGIFFLADKDFVDVQRRQVASVLFFSKK